ncbi:hypothetical protein F2P79_021804, partial [Pimephales promelas]
MSTRDKKRVMKAAKQAVTGSTNPLVSNCHDYTTSVGQLSLMPSEDDFPSYPATPCKPPASKKALLRDDCAGSTSNSDIVDTLSTLINARSDAIEKMVGENTMKIEGLKMTIDFACREIKDVKKRVESMEKCVKKEEEEVVHLKVRVTELENYSRRWNLKLFGIPESIVDVKIESIQICQAILPQDQNKVAEAIDIVHRLGKRQPGVSKPRGVILRFLSRTYRDAVWAAAKNNSFLREKGLRFAEDLPQAVKEIRAKLWPAIQKARSEGKSAYFVGARAFIGGVELRLQQNEEGQRKAI